MKYFLKSLLTTLLLGLPLIAIFCIWMFFHQKNTNLPLIQKNPVPIREQIKLDKQKPESEEADTELTADSNHTVTLSFAGDVHFSELILDAYDKSGISALVDETMLSHMQNADLFMLNHEFVLSNRGEAMDDKQYTLRNDPEYVKILQDLGTDVVSIANNHILDFGQDAFLDTIDTLENADIQYVGGGRNIKEASAPLIKEINGQTFAFLAATRVSPSADWYAGKNHPGVFQTYDATALNKAIEEVESKADHTIVFVHWGVERSEIPEDYQRTLAKGYIDAGADLVIGAHPHVLQGFEYYQDVPIVYSLGNYLFGNRSDATVLLNATFDENKELSIQLIPCKRSNGTLNVLEDPTKVYNHLTDISFDAAISHSGALISQ